MNRRLLIIGIFLCLLAGSLSAQEVYRWVDDEGNVHFTDTPPEDERDSERVQIRSGPAALAEEEDEDEDADSDRSGPRLSEAECEGMEERLAEYRDADVLYRINDQGEQEELEAEVAQAEMDRLQRQIDDYCD
ncbi:hypothetical protein J2T60_002135 [Natronospira proteinivora]|uniref:DUF4124 domain-containing protein n=1 Tax=Natronospira proteinivora TaxID=1807133 RepID=A0ABT1G9X5_9GAMM|nr:DUF4124 domain-containing protein [Natronospira proteinivora]MCP1728135.1 hypothetical protein [Natronospira proteinivora]